MTEQRENACKIFHILFQQSIACFEAPSVFVLFIGCFLTSWNRLRFEGDGIDSMSAGLTTRARMIPSRREESDVILRSSVEVEGVLVEYTRFFYLRSRGALHPPPPNSFSVNVDNW